MSLLKVDNLSINFGGIKALTKVNMDVDKGSVAALIGPNGAGKTTVFNVLTGIYEPTTGTINFDDKLVNGQSPYIITSMGISRTFQNIRLFKELSVLDNVRIALQLHTNYGFLSSILRSMGFRKGENKQLEEAMDLLKVFNLDNKRFELAKNLPYGEQRRLEIARALATRPKLLLLDEPAAGMNNNETRELMDTILFVRDNFDTTILLIEHDMSLVMGICENIYVLDYGKVIASGKPDYIRKNPNVIKAYLGEEAV